MTRTTAPNPLLGQSSPTWLSVLAVVLERADRRGVAVFTVGELRATVDPLGLLPHAEVSRALRVLESRGFIEGGSNVRRVHLSPGMPRVTRA